MRNQKRRKIWAAAVGAGIVGVTSLALADVPKTFEGGDVLRAADLNTNFAGLDARLAALEQAAVVASEAEHDPRWGLLHAAAVGMCGSRGGVAPGAHLGIVIARPAGTCADACAARMLTCVGSASVGVGSVDQTAALDEIVGYHYDYGCANMFSDGLEVGAAMPDVEASFTYCCCGDG